MYQSIDLIRLSPVNNTIIIYYISIFENVWSDTLG